MEAASVPWRPIGELFVARGLISEGELEQALAEQTATGRRLGEILVERDLISSPELTEVLMEQLGREVAKQEGFGSGLWEEIQRRNARAETVSRPSEIEDDRSLDVDPDGPALDRDPTADHSNEPESKWDLAELPSELHVVRPPHAAIEPEFEATQTELASTGATIAVLEAELSQARSDLSDRERQVVDLRSQVEKLAPVPEHPAADRAADEELFGELERARKELQVLVARLAELDETLLRRDACIAELEKGMARLGAGGRGRRSRQLQAELESSSVRVSELEEQVGSIQASLGEADALLCDERAAHSRTRQELEEARGQAQAVRDELAEAVRSVDAHEHRVEALTDELVGADTGLVKERQGHETARLRAVEAERSLEAVRAESLAELDELRARLAEAEVQVERLMGEVGEVTERAARERQDASLRADALDRRLAEESAGHAEARQALSEAVEELATRSQSVVGVGEEEHSPQAYLCFAPGKEGYRLVHASGLLPAVGDPYDLDGVDHVVTRIGRSPLPFDDRRCVYVQAA